MRAAILISVLFAFILGAGLAAVKKDVTGAPALATGKQLFVAHCASCHGSDGKGQHAPAGLRSAPPDLTTLTLRNNGAFPFARVSGTISGDLSRPEFVNRQMPCFGLILHDADDLNRDESHTKIASLTEYIRSLQVK